MVTNEPTADVSLTPFSTHPDRYRHWTLVVEGPVARMSLEVQEEEGPEYLLKQNSYDLYVDIELSDAIQRVRFEHPEVKVVVFDSAVPRVFCAGANIYMLGKSTHAFKVNFCKFTNETRLGLEDLANQSGVKTIAALNGTAAGGGYELALACEEIYLIDDGNSAVSFPEVPLLAVLPGTGGLTRIVDKRKVRRDLADIFCTVAEGVKGQRAKKWNLVDDVFPRSKWDECIQGRVQAAIDADPSDAGWTGVALDDVAPELDGDSFTWNYVRLQVDPGARTADLTVTGPAADAPDTADAMHAAGASFWALQAFRELDRALLHLRVDLPGINVVTVRTEGDRDSVLRLDAALYAARDHGFVREVILNMARVLRRMDLTAKSFFALIEPGSCFAGSLFELALAADRSYLLADDAGENGIALSPLNGGVLPMSHEQTRLAVRFIGDPGCIPVLLGRAGETFDAEAADEAGLVTMSLDDLDFEDETRLALEERASLSPDALTGMEASLRFPGAENCDSKIFGRLSAWQNWIFQRPNAVGPKGALTNYGQPTRPEFDYRRT
ncbi:MAG: benzoyl-CoA-dihydrodiol lyase [Deltaproteobacteria bacterium]|nr:benzoyl-CoA-dihydrodiol lyase [Deltaproteobacteria bacterium]